MSTVEECALLEQPRQLTEARQSVVDYYCAANKLIESECVLFDFDDTLVVHDPDALYWTALHTLVTDHAQNSGYEPLQFVRNHDLAVHSPQDVELQAYLAYVRKLSHAHTGDENMFEKVAQAFKDNSNDGISVKAAIKMVPKYRDSTGAFWEARSNLLNSSGVSSSFGKRIRPGVSDLINQLYSMGKKIMVVSNSRSDLVVPTMSALLPNEYPLFSEILTLGDSSVPIKPAANSFDVLQDKHDLRRDRCVYVGNASEDVIFADNAGISSITVGYLFDAPCATIFAEDVSTLARVVRLGTDGAALYRIASKEQSRDLPREGEFVQSMTPIEMRNMVMWGLVKLWERKLTTINEAYRSRLWANDFLSLKCIQDFPDRFGPISGEINISMPSNGSVLTDYYTDERLYRCGDAYGLRGPKYFTCIDTSYEPEDRLSLMLDELYIAVDLIERIRRDTLHPHEFLEYIGILDNAKQHALSIYHALIYNERRVGISTDPGYLSVREKVFNMAVRTVRTFYEASLGRPFTTPTNASEVAELKGLISDHDAYLDAQGFRIQELDHPLKIMLSAYNLARGNIAETVIGFPSGGTQLAIATALFVEIMHDLQPQAVDVVCLPLSQHSGVFKRGVQPIGDHDLRSSAAYFEASIKGKHVIIVDDNASTGSTMVRGTTVVEGLSPASILSGVAEIDPRRTLIRARGLNEDKQVTSVADMRHKIFETAVGVVPISLRDTQLRKQYAYQVLSAAGHARD